MIEYAMNTATPANAPTQHTLTLQFGRFLSEDEWRAVVEAVKSHVPHVKHLVANAIPAREYMGPQSEAGEGR